MGDADRRRRTPRDQPRKDGDAQGSRRRRTHDRGSGQPDLRRCECAAAGVGGSGGEVQPQAPRPDSSPQRTRRRPDLHAQCADPGHEACSREGRPEHRGHRTSSRSTKLLPRSSWPGSRKSAQIRPRSTSTAARSHSVTRSAATGTKLMATLLNELERTGGRYGLLTICEGGGTANATIIERL